MEKSGLVNNILDATISIDFGRKGFAIRGKAEEGRILYEEGIALAMSTFGEVQASTDPETIICSKIRTINYLMKIDNIYIKNFRSIDEAYISLKRFNNFNW